MAWLVKPARAGAWAGRALIVSALLAGGAGAANAQDFFDFLNRAFGGGGAGREAAPSAPQQGYDSYGEPSLTVRPRPRLRRHRSPAVASRGGTTGRYNVADLKGVTIYTDRTLARGDAVMTPAGMRVFNGAASWPHTDDDFVAVADSSRMSAAMRKELTAMDTASRVGLRR